jgi:hypothetical protein
MPPWPVPLGRAVPIHECNRNMKKWFIFPTLAFGDLRRAVRTCYGANMQNSSQTNCPLRGTRIGVKRVSMTTFNQQLITWCSKVRFLRVCL